MPPRRRRSTDPEERRRRERESEFDAPRGSRDSRTSYPVTTLRRLAPQHIPEFRVNRILAHPNVKVMHIIPRPRC
jgi:hypothetical protein